MGKSAATGEKQCYRGCNWRKRLDFGCEHLICEQGHILQEKGDIGFPSGPSGKEPACQCRRHERCGFDPWEEPLERPGNPLQHSCLENPMDRGAWWASVHRVAESDINEAT